MFVIELPNPPLRMAIHVLFPLCGAITRLQRTVGGASKLAPPPAADPQPR